MDNKMSDALHFNFSFFKDFIYLFLERGREGENSNVWLPRTRPQLGTWPQPRDAHRPTLNPLSHSSQGNVSYCINSENNCQSIVIPLNLY